MKKYTKRCTEVNAVVITGEWKKLLIENGWRTEEITLGDVYIEDEKNDNFIMPLENFNRLFKEVQ